MKRRQIPPSCTCHKQVAEGFAALAHPARIEIIRHLGGLDRQCCKDIVGHLDLAQSTVSQHLKVLVGAGFLRMKAERQSSRYEVNADALDALARAVAELRNACANQESKGKVTVG